jgi:hypothetical protein
MKIEEIESRFYEHKRLYPDDTSGFIDHHFECLLEVAKVAKNISSIWEDFIRVKPMNMADFFFMMQKYCDEYGALQIRIKNLEGDQPTITLEKESNQ